MVLLTDRTYDHGLRLGMTPVFDPQRFGSPSAALTGPAGRRSEVRPTPGRNKTLTYLKASHPHLAEMVESGLPVREAFSRVAAERQSRHRGRRSHPDVGATSIPNQDLTRAASSSPAIGGRVSRIVDAGWIGGQKSWNPDDPIGLDPQTIIDQQQPGGAFHGPVGAIGQTLFVPMIAAGDAVLRGGNALLHGGAAAAGATADELGLGPGSRLERDILTVPEAVGGLIGRMPSAYLRGDYAANRARQLTGKSAESLLRRHRLERLIANGGDPVKVGELTDEQVALIRRVVPKDTGDMFQTADGTIYATEGLLNSLRDLRSKHADRLIRRMPDIIKHGEVRENPRELSANRPIIIRKSPPGSTTKPAYDVMVLDAIVTPKKIGVPTMMTAPPRTINKARKP